jgi:hypothetical protein
MVDEIWLRRRVREAIGAGRLPGRLPDQLLGGTSTGGCCALCGDSTLGGIEMEMVFGDDGHEERRTYYAHPRCLWVFEHEVQDPSDRWHRSPDEPARAAD